jgi:phage-related baseplate assembly protein
VSLATARGDAVASADGSLVWAVTVRAENAGALRLHIENFRLLDGAEMYVYSRAGEAFGPYVGAGPDGTGEFWATSVFGNEAIVQVKVAGPNAAQTLRARCSASATWASSRRASLARDSMP